MTLATVERPRTRPPAAIEAADPSPHVRTVVRRAGAERSLAHRALSGAGRRLGWLRRLASLALLLGLWQVGSSRGWISPQKFPPPSDVWAAFKWLVSDGDLVSHLTASLGRIGKGLLLGGSAAILVGTFSGLTRIGEDLVDAPLQALRVIPNLALTSLFITWFGIGESYKSYLIALGAFFPLYLNTFGGIRNVDNKLVEAARIAGLNRAGLAAKVMVPGALPQILIGIRQSIGVAWLSLVVVEQTNARKGIGALIIDAREFSRTDIVVVGLLIYAVLGLLTDLAVRLLEKGALRWRTSFNGI
jgi:sulfonate transport system permease protein